MHSHWPFIYLCNFSQISDLRRVLKSACPGYFKNVLGCQICSVRFGGSRNCRKWKDHLSTHEKASKDKTRSAVPGSSHGVTEPCFYCGEKVISSGDALQNHIQDHHLDLTFSCRLCIPGERYFYNLILISTEL